MNNWNNKNGYGGRRNTNHILRCHLTKYNTGQRESHDVQTREGSEYTEVDIALPDGLAVGSPAGEQSEGLFVEVNGDPVNSVVIPIGDTGTRLRVKIGEVAIYKPDKPDIHFYIKENGDIEIQTDAKITHRAQEHIFDGDITVKGDIRQTGNLSVTGNMGVDGTSSINGNINQTGNLSVSGNISNGGNMTTGGVHNDSLGNHRAS